MYVICRVYIAFACLRRTEGTQLFKSIPIKLRSFPGYREDCKIYYFYALPLIIRNNRNQERTNARFSSHVADVYHQNLDLPIW